MGESRVAAPILEQSKYYTSVVEGKGAVNAGGDRVPRELADVLVRGAIEVGYGLDRLACADLVQDSVHR